ncbi:MAG: hypothetical protein AB1716_02450 [Planctomycetota bacterium]
MSRRMQAQRTVAPSTLSPAPRAGRAAGAASPATSRDGAPGSGARVCAFMALLVAAAMLLSVVFSFSIAAHFWVAELRSGGVHVLWRFDETSWHFKIHVGVEMHAPRFEVYRPSMEQTGVIGANANGWKTRDWYLRLPLWPACAAFAFAAAMLWSCGGSLGGPRRLVGQFLMLVLAWVGGCGGAALASAALTDFAELFLHRLSVSTELALQVAVPLALGMTAAWCLYDPVGLPRRGLCWGVSWLLHRWMGLPHREFDVGRCGQCGYDLTGNVSGRCPECGAAVAGNEAVGAENAQG